MQADHCRLFDIQTQAKLDAMEMEVQHGNALTIQLLHDNQATQQVLDRIETLSDAIADMSVGSMRSLASVCSSMSRVESRFRSSSVGRTPPSTPMESYTGAPLEYGSETFVRRERTGSGRRSSVLPSLPQAVFICDCCPKKPRRFNNEEDLR